MQSPTATSWSPDDALRHFAYRGIAEAVDFWKRTRAVPSLRDPVATLDFGSEWYGDDTGLGWASYMRGMLKRMFGADRVVHTLATYPPHDVQRMPEFAAASFDVAVVDNVLEHVERPRLAAEELHRVLRPGGVCVAMTPGLYPIHLSPLDCWRILPDGYRVLFPADKWETLTLGMWGSKERLVYELEHGAFPDGPPEVTVEQAMGTPGYVEGCDGRFPLVVWWVGVKR